MQYRPVDCRCSAQGMCGTQMPEQQQGTTLSLSLPSETSSVDATRKAHAPVDDGCCTVLALVYHIPRTLEEAAWPRCFPWPHHIVRQEVRRLHHVARRARDTGQHCNNLPEMRKTMGTSSENECRRPRSAPFPGQAHKTSIGARHRKPHCLASIPLLRPKQLSHTPSKKGPLVLQGANNSKMEQMAADGNPSSPEAIYQSSLRSKVAPCHMSNTEPSIPQSPTDK